MRPPCETVVKKSLPILRSLIIKDLIEKYDFSQVEVANKLGMTQAAISQYVSSKRGIKKSTKLEMSSELKKMARQIAKDIAENKQSNFDVTPHLCDLCLGYRGKKNTR
ncbi:transcriptional regulator [[Eubacterium] cellulosolvens]